MSGQKSIALFGPYRLAPAFQMLAAHLFAEGFFTRQMPDAHTIRDVDEVLNKGQRIDFAVIGLTGPRGEMLHLARVLNEIKIPCAIILCYEGYGALRSEGFADGKKVVFTYLLPGGAWDGGYDGVFELLPRDRMHIEQKPHFTPDMVGSFAKAFCRAIK